MQEGGEPDTAVRWRTGVIGALAAQPEPMMAPPTRPPTGFQVAGWLVLFQAGAVLVWAVSFLFTLVPPAGCGFLVTFFAGQAAFLFLVFWPVGLLIAVVGAKLRVMRAVITGAIIEAILVLLAVRSVGGAAPGFAWVFWWSILISAAGVLGLVLFNGRTWYASVVNGPDQDPAPQTLEAAADVSSAARMGCGCASVLPWLWARLGFRALRSSRAILVVGLLAPVLAIAANATAGRLLPAPSSDGVPNFPTRADALSHGEAQLYAPQSVAYSQHVDAGCSRTAEVQTYLTSSQSAAAINAWYDQWLTSHGWSLHPNPADMSWGGQLSHRDYRNGIHQQLIVAIDDPATLNRTLNPPRAKTYVELFYYLSYDKADRLRWSPTLVDRVLDVVDPDEPPVTDRQADHIEAELSPVRLHL